MGYRYSMSTNAVIKQDSITKFLKVSEGYFNLKLALDVNKIKNQIANITGVYLSISEDLSSAYIDFIETDSYYELLTYLKVVAPYFEDNSFIELRYPEDDEYTKLVFNKGDMQEIQGEAVIAWYDNYNLEETNSYLYIRNTKDAKMVLGILEQLGIDYLSDNSCLNLFKDEVVESRLRCMYELHDKFDNVINPTDELIKTIKSDLQDTYNEYANINKLDNILLSDLNSKGFIVH